MLPLSSSALRLSAPEHPGHAPSAVTRAEKGVSAVAAYMRSRTVASCKLTSPIAAIVEVLRGLSDALHFEELSALWVLVAVVEAA